MFALYSYCGQKLLYADFANKKKKKKKKKYIISYILPHIDYCGTVWGNINSTLTDCMIKLQKRAARIIFVKGIDTPSVEMFNQLSRMTFPERVTFQKAVMMYKIFNNLTPSYLPEYFEMTSDIHQRSLRSTAENLLYIPKPYTELYCKSVSYSGSKIWKTISSKVPLLLI